LVKHGFRNILTLARFGCLLALSGAIQVLEELLAQTG
jgi:hypothetical protein